jgi:hypothetical protein
LLVIGGGRSADAAPPAPAGFGSPPPGEYPIIYNDRNVYAKPDVLKQNRVLAALVKDGRIFVPLRSLFEQMGAVVSISDGGKVVTAAKTGASVTVTLGKAEVIINGETRPLDVPPILYKGIVLVPVRVISETLGAYVEWLGERQVVVVRYIPAPAAPAPTEAPAAAPAAAPTLAPPIPTPAPAATPAHPSYRGFVQGAFSGAENYNEFSAGGFCRQSYLLSGAYTFGDSRFAVKVDYREHAYVTSDNFTDYLNNRYTRFATIDGGIGFVPVFLARQNSLDLRLEYQIAAPRIYIGAGYLIAADNYGYPQLNGFGLGIEKLPELRSGVSYFGSAFYYPTVSGDYTVNSPASTNFGTVYRQQYRIVKYDLGLALAWARSPLYLYAGFNGDRYGAKQNAPIGQTHDGPYIGLGVKF